MNEQEHASQLSAFYDDELPASQAELVVRRALKDPQLRDAWSRYSLIGAAMRGEPLAGLPGEDLAARVSARLAPEPAMAVPESSQVVAAGAGEGRAWARGAWGMAIAASVAAVSLLVLRAQAPAPGAGGAMQVAAVDAAAGTQPAPAAAVARPATRAAAPATTQTLVASSEPPSYTTPLDNSAPGQVSAPLVNYVVAHSDVQASVVRFSPLSSAVSASYDPAEGAVEMTEAEIGAHR